MCAQPNLLSSVEDRALVVEMNRVLSEQHIYNRQHSPMKYSPSSRKSREESKRIEECYVKPLVQSPSVHVTLGQQRSSTSANEYLEQIQLLKEQIQRLKEQLFNHELRACEDVTRLINRVEWQTQEIEIMRQQLDTLMERDEQLEESGLSAKGSDNREHQGKRVNDLNSRTGHLASRTGLVCNMGSALSGEEDVTVKDKHDHNIQSSDTNHGSGEIKTNGDIETGEIEKGGLNDLETITRSTKEREGEKKKKEGGRDTNGSDANGKDTDASGNGEGSEEGSDDGEIANSEEDTDVRKGNDADASQGNAK